MSAQGETGDCINCIARNKMHFARKSLNPQSRDKRARRKPPPSSSSERGNLAKSRSVREAFEPGEMLYPMRVNNALVRRTHNTRTSSLLFVKGGFATPLIICLIVQLRVFPPPPDTQSRGCNI